MQMTVLNLHRDPSGRLAFTDAEGVVFVPVEPVRAFPLSDPDKWIALLDARGRELACIPDLADIPADVRELILRELADREFLPQIERVVRVRDSKDPEIWDVVTDRGPVQFLLGDTDDIRRLGPHRAIIPDVHGTRFYVPDSRQLDLRSQRILSRYL